MSHIIARVESIIAMNAFVDPCRDACKQLRLRQRTIHCRKQIIEAGPGLEVYLTFITKQTGLHIFQIVFHGLLIPLYITFQLELLCFQVIARIIFIRNSKRSNIHLHQTIHYITLSTHRKHLEHTVLSAVIGVLGTSFTLCNPNGLVLFTNRIVHITGHTCR